MRSQSTLFAFAALFSAWLFAACAAPVAEKPKLVVLTYNIHHGEGVDGVFDLERIAQHILDSEADLVALQEVDVSTGRSSGVDQAAELARLTGMQAVFGKAIDYDGGQYGDAVLTRLPIIAEEILPLRAEPHHEERVAVMVTVQSPWGFPLRFVGTHLDHTKDPSDRIRQATELLQALAPTGKQIPPTLLLGDLNAGPGTTEIELLLDSFDSAAQPALPTFPAHAPVKAIDWVLMAPRGFWQVHSIATLDAPIASDHLPVKAVLTHKLAR